MLFFSNTPSKPTSVNEVCDSKVSRSLGLLSLNEANGTFEDEVDKKKEEAPPVADDTTKKPADTTTPPDDKTKTPDTAKNTDKADTTTPPPDGGDTPDDPGTGDGTDNTDTGDDGTEDDGTDDTPHATATIEIIPNFKTTRLYNRYSELLSTTENIIKYADEITKNDALKKYAHISWALNKLNECKDTLNRTMLGFNSAKYDDLLTVFGGLMENVKLLSEYIKEKPAASNNEEKKPDAGK
jgi:hypothetical protein